MSAIIIASGRAVQSLFAPGMFKIMVICVLITIAALIAFVTASGFFFGWVAGFIEQSEISALTPWVGTIGAGVLAWFLFPGIMPVIVNFFGEGIGNIIEHNDYPQATTPRKGNFLQELGHDTAFSMLAILLNILVLPLYLIPFINVILFYLLNGYLLGREFFTIAARRHLDHGQSEVLRKHNVRLLTATGAVIAVMATIPLINLFAPFWGIAVMVHLYHRLGRPASMA